MAYNVYMLTNNERKKDMNEVYNAEMYTKITTAILALCYQRDAVVKMLQTTTDAHTKFHLQLHEEILSMSIIDAQLARGKYK